MMSGKRIAIVTGASSGIGAEFVRQILQEDNHFRESFPLDEIWILARREVSLLALKEELQKKEGPEIFPLSVDLQEEESLVLLEERLRQENPVVQILVNCAGYGLGGAFTQGQRKEETGMVRLNCEALTAITSICLPYMERKGQIINVGSAAAFLPQPDFAVYAASKAYVVSFSRALAGELKKREISVTAVCPGPVETPFFEVAEKYVKSEEYKKRFRVQPELVVKKALRDVRRGKELSVSSLTMKVLQVMAKILPHGWFLRFMSK